MFISLVKPTFLEDVSASQKKYYAVLDASADICDATSPPHLKTPF